MTGLPYMAWYPRDYLADTTHLTDEQDLAYRRLLDAMWMRGGKLPDDDAQLAAIVRYTAEKWHLCSATLRSFLYKNRQGYLVQKRLSAEYKKAQQFHDARVRGGRLAHSSASAQLELSSSSAPATRARVPEAEADKEVARKGKAKPKTSELKPETSDQAAARACASSDPPEPNGPRANGYLGEEDFSLGSWKSLGRSAPLAASPPLSRKPQSAALKAHKKELLRQKLLRFVDATMSGPAKSGAFAGLCGADPEHSEQWWLDTVDIAMRRDGWDDTSEFWEGEDAG